jgi:hypothetical protein
MTLESCPKAPLMAPDATQLLSISWVSDCTGKNQFPPNDRVVTRSSSR